MRISNGLTLNVRWWIFEKTMWTEHRVVSSTIRINHKLMCRSIKNSIWNMWSQRKNQIITCWIHLNKPSEGSHNLRARKKQKHQGTMTLSKRFLVQQKPMKTCFPWGTIHVNKYQKNKLASFCNQYNAVNRLNKSSTKTNWKVKRHTDRNTVLKQPICYCRIKTKNLTSSISRNGFGKNRLPLARYPFKTTSLVL